MIRVAYDMDALYPGSADILPSAENGKYLEHFRDRCMLFEPAAQQLQIRAGLILAAVEDSTAYQPGRELIKLGSLDADCSMSAFTPTAINERTF
jgi:hypothetical protein